MPSQRRRKLRSWLRATYEEGGLWYLILRAEFICGALGALVLERFGYLQLGIVGGVLGTIVGFIAGFAIALIVRITTMF